MNPENKIQEKIFFEQSRRKFFLKLGTRIHSVKEK